MPRRKKETESNEAAVAAVEPTETAPAAEPAQAEEARSRELPEYLHRRRTETGYVVSDKMEKTVVVRVERLKPHPLYHKVMRRSEKFMAHDELGAAAGDRVRIMESRPMSRRKRWQVVEILQRSEKI